VLLTRILLPAQLFFFAGGVFGAVLLVRKHSACRRWAPLIYGLGHHRGGLLLVHSIGVSSLAVGTVAGAFLGPFLLNAIFARRAGTPLPADVSTGMTRVCASGYGYRFRSWPALR